MLYLPYMINCAYWTDIISNTKLAMKFTNLTGFCKSYWRYRLDADIGGTIPQRCYLDPTLGDYVIYGDREYRGKDLEKLEMIVQAETAWRAIEDLP